MRVKIKIMRFPNIPDFRILIYHLAIRTQHFLKQWLP